MHDYMSLSWEGSAPAIDEFFADKPEFVIPVADFAGTVVVRKIAAASSQSFGKRAKRALGFNLFKRRPAQP